MYVCTYHYSIAFEIHEILHLSSQFAQQHDAILSLHFDVTILKTL